MRDSFETGCISVWLFLRVITLLCCCVAMLLCCNNSAVILLYFALCLNVSHYYICFVVFNHIIIRILVFLIT